MIELLVTPRRAGLIAGERNRLEVLVRVRAPARTEKARRHPLNLALVLDRSASMSGAPLEEAKRCAAMIVRRLTPQDRVAVVAYNDKVDVPVEPRRVDNAEAIVREFAEIRSGGTTALHAGWLKGAELLAPYAEEPALTRVILLSDGKANQGIRKTDVIAEQCAALAAAKVTTTTCGLGRKFNEDLMVAMARAGRGNHYYGQTADDLADPFDEELQLLSAMAAHALQLEVRPGPGVAFETVSDAGELHRTPAAVAMRDVAFGAESWILLRFDISPDCTPPGDLVQPFPVASVAELALKAFDPDGRAIDVAPVRLVLDVVSGAKWEALPEDATVVERSSELMAAELQRRARRASRRRDWRTVERLLEEARRVAKDNTWLTATVDTLERIAAERDDVLFSKEALYTSARISTRLNVPGEGPDLDPYDENRPVYLRRKKEEGKTR